MISCREDVTKLIVSAKVRKGIKWRDVTEADLLLRPDLATAFADPFAAQPTLAVVCDVAEPGTGLGYERDPRSAAARAWPMSCSTTTTVAPAARIRGRAS